MSIEKEKYEAFVKKRAELESKKYDQGKLRYDLIPPEILEGLASIFTMGAEKYGENTWQGIEIKRYVSALFRHLEAYRAGELYDKESGKLHLYHVMWNAGAIAYIITQEERSD